MRPGFGAARFDLLLIGQHDAPKPAPNILPILGAAHRISPERLAAARAEFAAFGALPSPRVALLMGGPPRAEGMDAAVAGAITAKVAGFAGSVLATASRRTGRAAEEAMAAALAGHPHHLFSWGDAPPNPYAGFLAWADQVVVTGDSVSMLSEALATSGPVFIADPGGLGPRHKRLAESLFTAGQARDLAAAPAPFARAALDESGRIAAEIRRRGLLA
jgi:mitochondrial fission protein ELM1